MPTQTQTKPDLLLQRLFEQGTAVGLSDADLIDRYVASRDPAAFTALVVRHGPLILAVCRGLAGTAAGDDAFQATWLIFLHRIGTFPIRGSLPGWLYRVARRVARQARVADARRRKREWIAATRRESTPGLDLSLDEVRDLIRQEVARLPERYRIPIVLCDLEGLTRAEAATLLGCPPGTIGGRVARGRERLKSRLQRRGITPAVGLAALARPQTWHAALATATRTAATLGSGAMPTALATALATSATRAALTPSLKVALGLLVVPCLAVALMVARRPADSPPTAQVSPASAPVPPARAVPPVVPDPDDPKLASHFVGRVLGPDGQPFGGARVYLRKIGPTWVTGPGPVRARSGADGWFEFDAPDMTFTADDGLPLRQKGCLIAVADGLAPGEAISWGRRVDWQSWLDRDPKTGETVVQLARATVSIRGRLLNGQNQPLVGARVRVKSLTIPTQHDLTWYLGRDNPVDSELHSQREPQIDRADLFAAIASVVSTDQDGRFTLAGVGDDRVVELSVMGPGVVPTTITVMTRPGADIVLEKEPDGSPQRVLHGADFTERLRASCSLSGVVRDRETHQPIPGMFVGPGVFTAVYTEQRHRWIFSVAEEDPQVIRYEPIPPVRTDANGRFTLTGIDPRQLVPQPPPRFDAKGNRLFQMESRYEINAYSPPGLNYRWGTTFAESQADLVIECQRGVPFRLTIVDEDGAPVDGRIESFPIMPNPFVRDSQWAATHSHEPTSQGIRRGPGVYEGFVEPGPGVVLVDAGPTYRGSHVNPKAFFAPGRTQWTAQERISAYGTDEDLSVGDHRLAQADYAAVVLVNPPPDSPPLVLTATVQRDRPQQITLVDPMGQPVVGAEALHFWSYGGSEIPFRSASFPLKRQPLNLRRQITFFHPERALVGFLRTDPAGAAAVTVPMQPWAAVTGRLLDETGQPLAGPTLGQPNPEPIMFNTLRIEPGRPGDPLVGEYAGSVMKHEPSGRFQIDHLIPGQTYSSRVYRGFGNDAGPVFENVVLQPGEVRDLGDIRTRKPVDVRGK